MTIQFSELFGDSSSSFINLTVSRTGTLFFNVVNITILLSIITLFLIILIFPFDIPYYSYLKFCVYFFSITLGILFIHQNVIKKKYGGDIHTEKLKNFIGGLDQNRKIFKEDMIEPIPRLGASSSEHNSSEYNSSDQSEYITQIGSESTLETLNRIDREI
jgi:purine-cytosine permease-like protein